jgi:hypothetical protein
MSQQILITPEMAKDILKNNHPLNEIRIGFKKNPTSLKTVQYFIRMMREGSFKSNAGIPIAISKNGILLNGQHRLYAIIGYGKPIFMHVVTDLDDEDFSNFDNGRPRNISDNTGITRKLMVLINQAISIATSNTFKKLTNKEAIDLSNSDFSKYANIVINSKSTNKAIISQAGFNIAAAVCISIFKYREDEIIEFRRLLTSGKLSELNELGKYTYEQLAKHLTSKDKTIFSNLRMGSSVSQEAFFIGMFVFNPNNWDRKRVTINDELKEKSIKQLKALLGM